MDNDASRMPRLRSLSNRINGFLTRLERNKRPPSRRERYHLVEAMQHLYEGRSEEVEAALARAEKIEPLPSDLTARPVPSDSVTVENLREGLKAILQRQAGRVRICWSGTPQLKAVVVKRKFKSTDARF
jgi:hypothetical protein